MSSVPKVNTQYRNNFIGQDRPIYGNELIGPTPNPTPTATYNCINCSEWTITNTGTTEPMIVRYYLCNTSPTIVETTLDASGNTEDICVCSNVSNPYANIEIIQGEGTLEEKFIACVPSAPTPTPSPSITATLTLTPTPSPTFLCSCTSYSIVNNDSITANLTYTDCNYNIQSTTIAAGGGLSFCGCLNTISITGARNVVITNLGECVPVTPTPSPTSTPPVTPTLSPSGIP